MDCGKLVRRVVGDPDETFSYRTSRTLVIKDWRVGISLLGLQFGVFCYICLYQIYSQQVYFAESDITGAVRLNPRAPAPAFSWNNGAAPFCSGATGPFTHPSTLISSYYTIVNDNNYTYTGPGSSGAGVIFPRYPCTYMDEANAIPLFEDDRLLIVTEVREIQQTFSLAATPTVACSTQQGPGAQGCTWRPVTGDLGNFFDLYTYVPDIEFYTIQFDHQVNAPQARVAKSVIDMRGTLRDSSGRIVDPCVGYTSFGLTCPGFVRIGVENRPDIVPVSTLLIAAGINTLDAVSGSDEFGSSRRSQGVVLIVDISYSNYCQGNILTVPGAPPVGGTGNCNTQDDVQYTYRVFAVPRTQFQISGTSIPANIFPIPTAPPNVRTAFRKYGLRIITTQSGRIGYFLFQTLLVNLVVSLGLSAWHKFAPRPPPLYMSYSPPAQLFPPFLLLTHFSVCGYRHY